VVLLPDDTCAVHAVWWASRSGAGGVEVRADPQQGTCGAGTTRHRESCGRMTRAKARQDVRVLSMLPQACRTGTTGPWASTAVPCIAALRHGGGRGWRSRAHQGGSDIQLKLPLIESMSFFLQIKGETLISSPEEEAHGRQNYSDLLPV
jgi:hypothetical protein